MNIKNTLVFIDTDFNNKNDLLNFVSLQAFQKNIVKDSNLLFESFINREKEASTGFEDGFAIPHAKVKNITQPSVVIVKNKNGIEWDSLDGLPIKYIICLIIPDNANEDHLNLLSSIATKLLKKEFKNDFINAKSTNELKEILLKEYKEDIKKSEIKNNKKLNIVAVTACVVGVAHTYMAEERLIEKYSIEGHNIRVETQGSKGVGTKLTQKEIDNADLVLIATDTNVDKSRFVGKNLYETKISKAVKDPLKLLDEALLNAKIYSELGSEFNNKKGIEKQNQGLIKHILAGISYMIPIIILGGICLAASLGIAKAIWGPTAGTAGPNNIEHPWNPLAVMEKIGAASFTLMIPILAAFIANSIGGRAAIAPALVGGFIGNDASNFMPLPGMPDVITPMGFIGSIIAGLLVGYFTKWVNTWKVPKSLKAAMPIFFIPIIGGVGISLLFIYVIGGPIGWIMQQFSTAIKNAYSSESIGLGLGLGLGIVLGAMAAFDMGGPINKIGFVTCVALLDSQISEPMGALAAGIPVAPLGMGLTSLIFKRFFDDQERSMGASALVMGMIGISEGAIPFAIRDPKRAITCNVLGGALAGGIAGAFRVQDNAGHGGPIVAILGAVPYGEQTIIFFIAIACGAALTTLLYGFWLLSEKGTIGSLKEAYVIYVEKTKNDYKELKLEIKNDIKLAKKNNDINSTNQLIEKLKLKNKELSDKLTLAKSVFNEIKVKDKKNTIEQKQSTKDYFIKLKQNKINKLNDIKQNIDNTKLDSKKETYSIIKQEKNKVVKNYKELYINKKIDLHIKYVNEFKSKL
ncbi:PTS system, fructose-specific IIB component [Spiroplasma litorale]|uniref:PTS system, fructose-specific IIB component n=1 Tax=Spiroplasma litorale TaxID=216942 RepID=A0A0K1W2A7_9MOLU|nr:fructose-specific PTS transporter subunit EIIC [Spiroplasma litorale]AKX34298.1 PTS system, fructose-specific IIB component [Spiroplasma litorale]